MKWLKYSTIPIGIFMLVLSLFAPKVQASTLNYNLTIINDASISRTNSDEVVIGRYRTAHTEIINNSVILTYTGSWLYGGIFWYDNSSGNMSYIGFHNLESYDHATLGTIPLNQFQNITNYIPANATHFRITTRNENAITVLYSNPDPIFQNETAVFNYNIGNAEIQVTSPQPTYDTGSITGRGLLIGDSANGFTSPTQLTVENAVSISPKLGGYTGDQIQTYTNIQPNTTYYIRSYVQYNNSVHYYSNGISITTTDFNVRTVDYIDWNGQVIYTTELQVGANITQLDLTAQNNLLGREGYTFIGWTGDTTVGHEFRTYERTAQYTQVPQYTVTFVDWDNTFIASGLVTQGESATLPPNPTRTGYRFLYWLPPVSDVQGNITTVAQYIEVFTLTWRDPSFNTLKIETVDSGVTGTPPNYVIDSGFVLTGWSPNPNIPPTQNTQYIAQVSPINPNIPPSDYNPITDLLGGVMGASVGAIMTLGTINLFGIYLYQLIFLFIGTTLTLWILKAVRG